MDQRVKYLRAAVIVVAISRLLAFIKFLLIHSNFHTGRIDRGVASILPFLGRVISYLFKHLKLSRVFWENPSGFLWQVLTLVVAVVIVIGLWRNRGWALRAGGAFLALLTLIHMQTLFALVIAYDLVPYAGMALFTMSISLGFVAFFGWTFSLTLRKEVIDHYCPPPSQL